MNRAVILESDLLRCYAPPSLKSVMPGNRVMLRSGGPEMIVSGCDGDMVWCQWMNGDGTLCVQTFDIRLLTCYGAR